MVLVNSQKFACESCVKGHRSSSCSHSDRPLFEIKKKGRPVSQCDTCRKLRKSNKKHAKCSCVEEGASAAPPAPARKPTSTKYKRYIPVEPSLPNGLSDLLVLTQPSPILVPADTRQRVDTLLNPCNCKNVWRCKCRSEKPAMPCRRISENTAPSTRSCCSGGGSSFNDLKPRSPKPKRPRSPRLRPPSPVHKRMKQGNYSPGPELPPIISTSVESSNSEYPSIETPEFPLMPPMSAMASLAGSGCTCGLRCACPGCVEHRGPEEASRAEGHKDCADGCGHCVDNESGIALPGFEDRNPTISSGVLEQFFAKAAALPTPPNNWRYGVELDPTNVSAYPSVVPGNGTGKGGFQLVNLPKLECCGGSCACPAGSCSCGQSCDGGCERHLRLRRGPTKISPSPEPSSTSPQGQLAASSPVESGCCCSS